MEINPRQRVKFLLVVDDEASLAGLASLVARPEVDLHCVRSGREALELLRRHEYGLAIIHMQLPEMDGLELARRIRAPEQPRAVPIVFLSEGTDAARFTEAYEAGAVDVLVAPLDPGVVRNKADTFYRLQREKQECAETLRLNEELLALVGHDLRNPLNVILLTGTMLASYSTDPELVRVAKRLKSSGGRMLRIINELMDASKARLEGGIPIARTRLDLEPLLAKVRSEHEQTHPTNPIEVTMAGDLLGNWDETRIEQIISNLIGSAIRYGQPNERIVLAALGRSDEVELSVRTAGIIAPEVLARLFEPFHTGPENRPRVDGLGLGLYIVHQIAIAHGGTADVESAEGLGTRLRVRLPREAPPVTPEVRDAMRH